MGLPAKLRVALERLSGFDLSEVRVHRNSPRAPRAGAHAIAQGKDIHLASGQEQHLPHEAWHVVQQAQGRVRSTAVVDGHAANDEPRLEREADVMGARALRLGPGRAAAPRADHAPLSPLLAGRPVVQCRLVGDQEKEVEAFFLREIRAIGSPYTKRHHRLLQDALNAPTVDAAKDVIRQFVRQWHADLDAELVGEQDEGAKQTLDERYTPTSETGPIFSGDLFGALGSHKRVPSDLSAKERQHFSYTRLKGMDRPTKLYATSDIAGAHGTTGYELEKRANTQQLARMGVLDYIDKLAAEVAKRPAFAATIQSDPKLSLGGLVGVYYRYHKFGDSDRSGLVFGGGFNKSDIDSDVHRGELHGKALNKYFSDRKRALQKLTSGTPKAKQRVLEDAQANAFSTPFIATSSNKGYPADLLKQYPPDKGQHAVMLTILGPSINTLDFEHEFGQLKQGLAQWNYRTSEKRAKDKEQAEFGIPDVFIPLGRRSPLGFVVAHVELLK